MKATIFLLLWCASLPLIAQIADEAIWEEMLSNRNKKRFHQNDSTLISSYRRGDSSQIVGLLQMLNRFTTSKDDYLAARSLSWKGFLLSRPPFNSPDAPTFLQQAVNRSVENGSPYLMIPCIETIGDYYYAFGKPENALFYFLKSAELRRQLNNDCFFYKDVFLFGKLGELLYTMQEYEQAIPWLRTAIKLNTLAYPSQSGLMNSLALTWQHTGQFDSAQYWYQQSINKAKEARDSIWEAIASGNLGWLYFEQKQNEMALPLMWKDFNTNINRESANAGNTLHRIALIYLERNKTDSALLLAKNALAIVNSVSPAKPGYQRNANRALSIIYRKMGALDSALVYNEKYHHLNDSLNRVLASNRADVAKTRLAFDNNSNRINILMAEKKAETIRRNLLLTAIAIVIVGAWMHVRWQKQKFALEQQILIHQKALAESEMANARKQLEAFAQTTLEKNELIEELQLQLKKQDLINHDALMNQTILTENDWLHFKDMFEKAHPGFLNILQQMAPGITTAELRYAALVKLNLGNKHMAAMLGVGADAIRKTKSRLRQRLQLPPENEPEDVIKAIEN
jgi:tetratricopeptide (TPR) repeat protein